METRLVVLHLYLTKLLGARWQNYQSDLKVRKEVQKSVYFLQEIFRIPFDYTYNLYIYGPYSQSLSKEAFALAQNPNSEEIGQNYELKDCAPNKIQKFKALFHNNNEPNLDKMELAATLHFLYKNTFASGTAEEREAKCSEYVKQTKPQFDEAAINASFIFLKENEMLNAINA